MGVTPTGLRARAAKFFGLGDDEIRVPGPASARVDVLLAVVLFLLSALGLELARSAGGTISAHPIWAEYLALVAMAAPIAARRRWPLSVAVATSLAFFVVGVTMPDIAIQFSVQVLYFFALFSAMAWARSRRQAVVVMGGVLLLMFGWLAWQFSIGNGIDQINAARGAGPRPEGVFSPIAAALTYTFLINIIYFGGATLGGQAAWRAGRQRAHLAEQTERLRAQAGDLREHAVVKERLRIARELHDAVAHHVSVMGIQAGAARKVLARDPAAASTALACVEGSSREAVTEMRALLGTLRQGAPDGAGGSSSRAPRPGVEAIGQLVEQLEGPDLTVRYSVVKDGPGALDRVSPAAGLTLYRTVQEALNNVRRHSTASRADVVLRVQTGAGQAGFAEVEVLDDGRPRSGTSGSGLGLLGMRERVTSLDGTLEIGPRVTGGFRVRVRLPLTTSPRG